MAKVESAYRLEVRLLDTFREKNQSSSYLFSYREGIVLNTVTYTDQGVEHPLFYRVSMAGVSCYSAFCKEANLEGRNGCSIRRKRASSCR